MKIYLKLLTFLLKINFLFLLFAGMATGANNIEFLDKQLIKTLNYGIYEVVTPKLEDDQITYAEELPFHKLDYSERTEKYFSIGTAFFINDTELMTAEHVFDLKFFSLLHDFYIRDSEGNVYPVNRINSYSTRRDMLVFDLKKYPKKFIPLQVARQVEIGDTVFSAGNAQGEGIAYRAGQVASFTPERELGEWKDIRFTSPASPGNSGGPLLNLKGKVVGLIVQKNQSENYNVAVPVAEIDNLSREKAEFLSRNVTVEMSGSEEALSKDWIFTSELPATVDDLADKAQTSLNDFWLDLFAALTEKVKDKHFPEGVRFRDYLRHQTKVMGFASLEPDPNYNKWRTVGYKGEKIPISATQNVIRGMFNHGDLHVIIEKPDDISLKEFLDSPKKIMDTLLKALPFSRQIGTEKIRVTSLGDPAKQTGWQDKMGRKWQSTLWFLPYSDSFMYSHCLPYPKGVICSLDNSPASRLRVGYLGNVQDGYNEVTIGYEGEIDDWVEYFSLGDNSLPKIFANSKIIRKDNNLKLEVHDFSFDFSNDEIAGDSSLHFHLGYSNEQLLAEELLLFELYPRKGLKSHYRIQALFQPGTFSSDRYKSSWHDVINGTGDFSGKLIDKGEELAVRKAVMATEKIFPAINDPENKTLTKVFATGCYYTASADGDLEQDCDGFVQSIDFN